MARPIRETTPAGLRAIHFAEGSMAPKVEVACRFVRPPAGSPALALTDAIAIVRGEAGTIVTPEPPKARAGHETPTGKVATTVPHVGN